MITPFPQPDAMAALADRCRAVLARRPSALLSDIDGTLSEIAPTPDAATVDDGVRASLRALAARLDLVAAISGRSTASGSALVGVPELLYVGNHGMERLERGEWSPHRLAVGSDARIAAALAEVEEEILGTATGEGVLLEPKGLTASVHYRLSPDPDTAAALLRTIVRGAAAKRGLRVTEGRAVIELRPDIPVDKGTSISELIRERGLKGAVFLGDDLTDVDAFMTLRHSRSAGAIDAISIGVVGPETPPAVRDLADATVDGVPGVAALLAALARG